MDYARFGRQIALAEIGVDGQAKLAEAELVAPHAVSPMASRLWEAACSVAPLRDEPPPPVGPPDLGVAAWWCVESARRALGQEARAVPAALIERLGG